MSDRDERNGESNEAAGHASHAGPRGWFDDPKNTRRFFGAFYVLCGALLLSEFVIQRHEEFSLEGRFGFYPVYGFFAIVVLVLLSIQLRRVVMRPEDYYER